MQICPTRIGNLNLKNISSRVNPSTACKPMAVDGLNTSAYLLDTAKDHIEGKITIDEAQQRIHSYYEQRTTRTEIENETKEADIVSARIAKLLGEKAFQFSPAE